MTFLTLYCEIHDHTKKMFFKIVIFNIVGLHPPLPSDFNGLLYHRVRWYPHFFHQNDSKGYKRDYLDALGHFFSVL